MLEELKESVVRAAREAEGSGLCRRGSGNFSARDEATGLVCVTPTGAARDTMTADDIVVMDMKGAVVEARSGLRPTSEALMHLAAYETRPDVFGVAHTHSRFALVLAALRRPILPVSLEAAHLHCRGGVVPVAPFARQGTAELAASVREPLSAGDATLLASHGVLTVDKELSGALLKAAYVEELAEVYCHALAVTGGKEPPTLSADDLTLSYPQSIKLL